MTNDPTASRMTPRKPEGCAPDDCVCAQILTYPGSLSSSTVTEMIGVHPTKAWDAGQEWKTAMGNIKVRSTTFWELSTEDLVDSGDMRDHLDWLLERLTPARDAIIEVQSSPGVRMGVRCISWRDCGCGVTLWPEQMRALADLNLECYVQIEGPEDPSAS